MIPQPARILLKERIAQLAQFVRGDVLDIGSNGFLRYKNLFTEATTYQTMDIIGAPDIQGSVISIPHKDGDIGGILCTQVLGDVFDLKKAFSEMYRVLEHGGSALISESFIDPKHDEPNDYWRFTDHALKRLAEEAGFTVAYCLPYGGYKASIRQLKTRHAIQINSLIRFIYKFMPLTKTIEDTMPLGYVLLLQKL